ncbi:O-methyltransferase family protein [Candidatus Nitrosarchaeum limnium SFB1]|uniref:O-methyltransferase family protein n=1 Tax=Candidatus Nitrosarchaeum limnium SFB1 TaxID=886738 RepID=F3KKE0_9ARCH|nr:O-methyltransferase family protein [Candidatus Nitrosarchaeum limnium SFB1]
MNKKIASVLRSLDRRSTYEEKNYHKVERDQRMLAITRDTGIFYNLLLKTHQPKKILEIGMSVGYSTLWFAGSISKKSKIITIEQNPQKIERAKINFKKAGVSKMIDIKQGVAKDVLTKLSKSKSREQFDFIFIDADKEQYSLYFDLCVPLLKKDGIIAADNILYPTRFKKYIQKYLNHIHKNKRFDSVTVPVGNGQELSFLKR